MSKLISSYSRKRQRTEQLPSHLDEVSQPEPKRQRYSFDEFQPPLAYWNHLSKIWLTERALRELDRRNSQRSVIPPHSAFQQIRRPITRSIRSEVKNHQSHSAQNRILCLSQKSPKLKEFARRGGPDLSDLRGYLNPVSPFAHLMSSSQSSRQSRGGGRGPRSSSIRPATNFANTTIKTKSSGAYSRNFEQNLIDHKVYPHAYEHPDGQRPAKPDNWEDIHERLRQPRSSLSPSKFSEEAHEEFMRADARATKEDQVREFVIASFAGTTRNARCVSGGILWGNFEPMTDGTLKPAKPDFYEGAPPEQLNRELRQQLSAYIVPSTQDSLPILPNFSLEAKGPDGTAAVAERQAMYNGALGARALQILQSQGQDRPFYDNRAHTISATYSAGQLKMFTTHLVPPDKPDDRPFYYRHQIKGWAMSSDVETFRNGATAFRNARDWAKEQRDDIIKMRMRYRGEECEETQTSIEEADEIDEDEEHAQAVSLSTLTSFAEASTSQLPSTQTEDESDTSAVERVRLSAKRSPSQSPKARRHKRKHGSRRRSGSKQ